MVRTTSKDSCREFDGEAARNEIAAAFGSSRPPPELIEFDPRPVAAASLAQVHRGKWMMPDGTAVDVAIKVLRPGLLEDVGADLVVLLQAGDVLSTWAPRVLQRSQVTRSSCMGVRGSVPWTGD